MAIQVFGVPAAVVFLNRAFNDASPSNLIYQNHVAAATANLAGWCNDFGASFATLSDSALATRVLGNLGLLPNATLEAALADYYRANGAGNRGFVTYQLASILSTLEGDATYGAAASAWNNEVAASYTYSANAANTTSSSGNTNLTAQSLTLTTDVDTVTGGAGDDTITGSTVNGGTTFSDGDIVNGGAGTDTLTLTAGGSATTVALNGVEVVDVRLLQTQTAIATLWSGVQSLTINSDSLVGRTLTVADARVDWRYNISKSGVTLGLQQMFDVSGSADTLNLAVDGNGVSATVLLGSSVEALALAGNGSARIDLTHTAGAQPTSLTVSGQGTLVVSDSDGGYSSINLAGFSGTTTITTTSATALSYTGGAGNDTINLGASLTSADRLDGGGGVNTIGATIGGLSSAFSGVTNFTQGNFSVAGGAVSENFSGFTLVTFSGATSQTSFAVSGLAAGATIKLDHVSSQTTTRTFGLAAGSAIVNFENNASADATTYGNVVFSGATDVNVNFLGSGVNNGAITIGSLRLEGSDVVDLGLTKSSDSVVLTELRARDAETLNISLVSGNNSLGISSIMASGVTSQTVSVGGSATTYSGVGLFTTGIATTVIAGVSGNNARIELGQYNVGNLGSLNFTINADQDADVLSLLVSATGSANASFNVTAGASSTYSAGTISLGAAGSAGVIQGFTFNINSFSAIVGDVSVGRVSGMSITVAQDGDFNVGNIRAGSSSVAAIGNIDVFVGPSATVEFGAITSRESATVGNITITGSGTFSATSILLSATGTIGNISVADGYFNIGTAEAQNIGNLSLGGDTNTIRLAGSTLGSITITGSASTVYLNGFSTVGDVTITGGATSSIHTFDASSVGKIGTISTVGMLGSANITFAVGGTAAELNMGSGSQTITLSNAGSATQGTGFAINLSGNTGTDTLRFASTAIDGARVMNFQWGSSQDKISLASAGFSLGMGSALSNGEGFGDGISVLTVGGATSMQLAAAAGASATEVLVLVTGTFNNVNQMLSALANGGSLAINSSAQGAISAQAGEFAIVWYNANEQRTELSIARTSAIGAGANPFGLISSAAVTTIATFSGDIRTFSAGESFAGNFSLY